MRHASIRKFFSFVVIFTLVLSSFSSIFGTFSVKAESNPLTVAEAISNNSGTATVEGYIVGTVSSSKSFKLDSPFTINTNLAIADSPNETEISKMLPVQLPKGSIRDGLNLVDNPRNYQAKVQISGNLEAYFAIPGLKNPTSYTLLDSGQAPEPELELELTPISEARTKAIGTKVMVQGIITADNSAIGGGKLSTYLQDDSAGINLYSNSAAGFPNLKEGDSIQVIGTLASYNGLLEIKPETMEVVESGQALPIPQSITIADLQNSNVVEPLEGSLVNVTGFVKSIPSSPAGGGYNVSIIDEELNSTTLRIMEGSLDITSLEEGNWYDVTAILSQYNSYQLIPRKEEDLSLSASQPEAPSAAGEYEAVVASVTDGDTIKLSTPVLGSNTVRYVNIDTPETYHSVVTEADQNQKEHGEAAKAYMNTLLKAGDQVILKVGEEATDAYGRLLAQVIKKEGNVNTNLAMVEAGFASTYFIWPVGSEVDSNLFQAAVKQAKDAELGIWNQENPLMELPFEFRAREQGKGLLRYVGNSETKEYVNPENWADVPVEKRVFFASVTEAETNGYTAVNQGEEPSQDTVKVQLLSVNDLHGKIDVSTVENGATVGSMDYLAAYLREREATNPNTLIVHAGDMVGGSSPVSALLQDEPTVEMMESIGFDVGTVGNHEFDEGVAEMLRLINGGDHINGTANYDGIDFPMVAANVQYKDTKELILDPYKILEVGGEKIAFMGVATTDTPNMIISTGNENVEFTNEVSAINKFVPEIQAQGVEAIVVLAHVPGNQSGESATGDIAGLANGVNDAVDVIFAAHNHVKVNALVDNKLIVQAGEYGKAFGDIDLEIDLTTGDIVKKSAKIVDVVQEGKTPDAIVNGLLNQYFDQVGPKLNEVIGKAATEMKGGYATKGAIGDNALGNLIADGMAAAMNADFALMNGGGIRDDLNAGDITWDELFNIQPFGNTLVKVEVSGDDLRKVLNTQFSSYGPDVSIGGFSYMWESLPGGRGQVVDIFLPDGNKINPNETYTVVVNNYMYPHSSDKYRLLELGENPVNGPDDLQATVDFVKGFNDFISYKAEGRISELVPDHEAPTSAMILPTADFSFGSYLEEVEATILSSDSGRGVDYIQYSLDQGENWENYEEKLLLTEGSYEILFRAIDRVGNVEEAQVIQIEVLPATVQTSIEIVEGTDVNSGIKNSMITQLTKIDNINNAEIASKDSKNIEKTDRMIGTISKRVKNYPSQIIKQNEKEDILLILDSIVSN